MRCDTSSQTLAIIGFPEISGFLAIEYWRRHTEDSVRDLCFECQWLLLVARLLFLLAGAVMNAEKITIIAFATI